MRQLHLIKKQLEETRIAFRVIIELDVTMGKIYEKKGQDQEAIDEYEIAIR